MVEVVANSHHNLVGMEVTSVRMDGSVCNVFYCGAPAEQHALRLQPRRRLSQHGARIHADVRCQQGDCLRAALTVKFRQDDRFRGTAGHSLGT